MSDDGPIDGRERQHWRFATLYFLSFASTALFGIYWSVYLKRRGVSNVEIGALSAIGAWVGTLAPAIWGVVSDSLRRRKPVLATVLATAGALFPLFWFWSGEAFWQLAVLMGVFTFFFRPSIPLHDAWTLEYISRQGGDYGRIRSWGSVGFVAPLIASVFVLQASDASGVETLLPVFVGFSAFRLAAGAFTLTMPEVEPTDARPKLDVRALRVYLRPFAITFFVATFVSRFVFGPYYSFFSVYLDELGVADNLKGIFWVVAVGAEVGMIAASGALLKRFGSVTLVLAALSAMAFRLWVYSTAPSWPVVLATQSLHAVTFGAFHVASMQIIHRITPEAFRASGQTFYGAILGLGGVAGGFVGGAIAEARGLPGLFRILSVVCVAATVLIAVGFRLSKDE